MLQVSWIENATSERIKESAHFKIESINKSKNISYLDHMLRNERCEFLHLIFKEKIDVGWTTCF